MYFFIQSIIISSTSYSFLCYKTKISSKYLYLDNLAVIIISGTISNIHSHFINLNFYLNLFLNICLVFFLIVVFTMLRFYRVPNRKTEAKENDIVSPADGTIVYIKKIETNDTPFSVKNKKILKLEEIAKTDLFKNPVWLIGINMTLFDVHKNCSPISGEVVLNKYSPGNFLSLKKGDSDTENERNTMVFRNEDLMVGMVQIASKRVRRIVSYVDVGEKVKMGQWVGMIKFGSQVDVIFPINYKINISIKEQVYAGKTIIAGFMK